RGAGAEWELDAVLPGVDGQFAEETGDLCGSAALQNIIKRVEPLARFGGVELRCVFGSDMSHWDWILSACVARRPFAKAQGRGELIELSARRHAGCRP